MRNLIRLDDIEPLLQIHARTERLVTSTGKHGASQLWLGIVPLP